MKEINTKQSIDTAKQRSLFSEARLETSNVQKKEAVRRDLDKLVAANRPGLLTEILNQEEPYRLFALELLNNPESNYDLGRIVIKNISSRSEFVKIGKREIGLSKVSIGNRILPMLDDRIIEVEANEVFSLPLHQGIVALLGKGKEILSVKEGFLVEVAPTETKKAVK